MHTENGSTRIQVSKRHCYRQQMRISKQPHLPESALSRQHDSPLSTNTRYPFVSSLKQHKGPLSTNTRYPFIFCQTCFPESPSQWPPLYLQQKRCVQAKLNQNPLQSNSTTKQSIHSRTHAQTKPQTKPIIQILLITTKPTTQTSHISHYPPLRSTRHSAKTETKQTT